MRHFHIQIICFKLLLEWLCWTTGMLTILFDRNHTLLTIHIQRCSVSSRNARIFIRANQYRRLARFPFGTDCILRLEKKSGKPAGPVPPFFSRCIGLFFVWLSAQSSEQMCHGCWGFSFYGDKRLPVNVALLLTLKHTVTFFWLILLTCS